jgi:hypothetical protein
LGQEYIHCECHCDGCEEDDDDNGDGVKFRNPGLPGSGTVQGGTSSFPQREYERPEFEIPQSIKDQAEAFSSKLAEKLGLEGVAEMFKNPSSSGCFEICIENPFKNVAGLTGAHFDMKACLNVCELAQQEWVFQFRLFFQFMVFIGFIAAVVVVLRQY